MVQKGAAAGHQTRIGLEAAEHLKPVTTQTPGLHLQLADFVVSAHAVHIAEAIAHHQAGRLAEAEALYRKVLATTPDHPSALHMLGVLAAQVGRNDVAVELISKAPGVKVQSASGRGHYVFIAHCNTAPFNNLDLRLALKFAMNRKEMVDKLTSLIGIFESPALDFSKNRAEGDDILGDAYEYLMRHFASESGKSKGQFYTPSEVSRIIAKVIGISPENTMADWAFMCLLPVFKNCHKPSNACPSAWKWWRLQKKKVSATRLPSWALAPWWDSSIQIG